MLPSRKYECYWEREDILREEIVGAWKGQPNPWNLSDVQNKLGGVMDTLQCWSTKTIGSISKKIERLRKQLGVVSSYHDDFSMEEKRIITGTR
jgi:hypothetical protein